MTRYVIFLCLFLIGAISFIMIDKYSEAVYVFNESDNIKEEYEISCVRDCNIFTVIDTFNRSDIKVLRLYPKNKLIIDDDLVNSKLESFSYDDPQKIVDKYKNILLEYGLFDDYDKVDIYGVVIDKIILHASKRDIIYFIKSNNNYQMS